MLAVLIRHYILSYTVVIDARSHVIDVEAEIAWIAGIDVVDVKLARVLYVLNSLELITDRCRHVASRAELHVVAALVGCGDESHQIARHIIEGGIV